MKYSVSVITQEGERKSIHLKTRQMAQVTVIDHAS